MTAVIIQARMGSSRLPGKVLRDINGTPLLGRLLERLRPSKHLNAIVVATSTNPEDDAIEQYCIANDVRVHRGSDWDVLDRFFGAVSSLEESPDHVVRICADNPLHHHSVLDTVMDNYLNSGTVYFSNSNHEPHYLEDGFDTEIFSFESLEIAWKNAKLLSEREHVCPYIKKRFSCGWKKLDEDYQFKLSVDTQADLDAVNAIFAELDGQDFGIHEVVALLKEKPEILELNKESIINAGFSKTLNEDRIVK